MGDEAAMTEAEAREKWCPLHINGPSSCCIGSGCMAWRTGYERKVEMVDTGPPVGEGWEKTGKIVADTQLWERPMGYCGLAGSP
jgi:hypothetical protein